MKAIRLLSIYDVSELGACSIFVQTLENFKHAVWNKNINLKACCCTHDGVIGVGVWEIFINFSPLIEPSKIDFNFIAIFFFC